jgi:hypothetical protein
MAHARFLPRKPVQLRWRRSGRSIALTDDATLLVIDYAETWSDTDIVH